MYFKLFRLFSLQIRKVYALSRSDDFESYWIIFDISTQNWAVYPNKVDFGWNCCTGNVITVRGFHYFFHKLEHSDVDSSPINKILENGTMVDLNMNRPFEKEYNIAQETVGKFALAPFYQRFIEMYQNE